MISKLRLSAFRAYERAELEFDEGFNRVIGRNGVGKTSLLEGLSYVGLGSSPWSERSGDVVMEGKSAAAVEGWGPERRQEVSIEMKRGGRKDVRLAGKRIPRLSELLGVFPTTAVGPREIDLVKGSPGERRRLLDSVLCQMSSDYVEALSRFKKLLYERNAALKGVSSGEMAGGHVLIDSWDSTLSPLAGRLMADRLVFVQKLSRSASTIYDRITGGTGGKLSIEYSPTIRLKEGETGPGEIEEKYYERLVARRKRDLDYGETDLGPHRDDLDFKKDGRPLSRYGSWGQARAASIAVLLASSEILHGGTKSVVTLLLDDCFAELDPENTRRFVEIVADFGQVVIASPRPLKSPSEEEGALFVFDDVGKIRREK